MSRTSIAFARAIFTQFGETEIESGNATYAGGFAAIMANVVLIAYIIVAMREDQTEKLEAEEKRRKAQ